MEVPMIAERETNGGIALPGHQGTAINNNFWLDFWMALNAHDSRKPLLGLKPFPTKGKVE